ncbi:hypothetical protein [Streptomyces cellostaticus]|nr:hypothetical protein [Streptomyces cellostaticus]
MAAAISAPALTSKITIYGWSITDLQSVVSEGLTPHDPCGMPTA